MTKRYRVTLTADERDELERLLARGKADVRKIKHAQILLKADEADEADGGPGWPDQRIAEALEVGIATVERVRRRFVEEDLASALSPYRGGKRIYEHKLDGAQEAHLIALACSAPPEGRARWTLRLLAQHMVELADVDTLSHETVRQTLKKMRSSRTRGGCGESPRTPRRSSSTTWKMCWRSTVAGTIPSAPAVAGMRPSNSSSARPGSLYHPGPGPWSASIMFMSATEPQACSSPVSRSQAGVTLRSPSIGAEQTGRASSIPFWRGATEKPRSWC